MKFSICVRIVLAAVTLSSATVMKSSASSGDNFELLILHNNDMHARFEQTSQLSGACTTDDREAGKCYGGFPRVAHIVKKARAAAQSGEGPPVLYLNAGDTYTGTAWFTIYKWKIAAEFINALQPDAVSLGNHELDNGVRGLTPFIQNLTCPVLAANLILNEEPDLEAERNLMKSVIININGTKIGIIGYLTPETKFLAQKNNIEYIEEIAAIKEEAATLKRNGTNILIALGHSGFTKDLQIAKDVDDIDIVIGGHTNTFLWNGASPDSENQEGPYPTVVKQASGRIVAVVQAYAYTKYIGKLHLVFDSRGEIIKFDGNPILLDKSVPQDPDVLSIVDHYKSEIVKISEIVDGNTAIILDGDSCRIKECNIGNLIADALVYKYAKEYKGPGWIDAPIAVIQGGGIRASIAHINLPAKITRGDLLSVMPFGGDIVKLEVNGTMILAIFEHAVAQYDSLRPPGQFLQVSGLKVIYNLKNPSGKRVVNIMTLCGLCEIPTYSVLNESASYKILIPAFLAMGGDGFSFLNGLPSSSLGYDELEATTTYIQGYSPIYPAVEGRILFSNAEQLLINSVSKKTISLWSLGNHEFDNGVSGLTPFIENLTCPVLAANLILNKVPELAREENLKKSIVLDIGNNKIGIIGYLTPDTKTLAVPNDVEYIDEVEAINKEVKTLQDKGIKIIIALGHSGYIRDLQIAKEVEGVDLIIGGHTNTFLWNGSSPDSEHSQGPYPTYVTQASGKRIPVVQAYAYTKYLGNLHLTFDANGELISADGKPLLLDYRIPQDPNVLEIIQKYRKDVLATTEEVLGNTSVILDATTCQINECNLGNLITDAIIFRYAVNYKGEHWTDAPIALLAGGGIRSSVAHAKMPIQITKGDLLSVLPFDGNLVAVTMNGTILKKMFEHSVSNYNTLDMPGEFLQISGIKVTYNLKKPVGSRVVSVEARCWACNIPVYSKVEDKQIYKVLTSTFVYNGGDGFGMLKNLPKEALDYNELMCTEYYVSRHSPIYPQVEGRITFVEQDYQTASSPIIRLSLSAAIISIIGLILH